MGLELRSPIVVSACTLSEQTDNIQRMEDAGAGGVVMFSLFEEQIRRETESYSSIVSSTVDPFTRAQDIFPEAEDYRVGSEEYLELIREAKERVDIPIIASLNSISNEGWIFYAQQIAAAGADALEVNVFYIPADINLTGQQVEQRYIDIITQLKKSLDIPVAIKLNPYFSALGHMAAELESAGADGLVMFNRFYQPDLDIRKLRVSRNLELSHSSEIRLPLLWISSLYGKLKASLAATTGVDSAVEIIKYLLAGADVVMTASALYKHGIEHIILMEEGLKEWMAEMHFDSLDAFRGTLSQKSIADPTAYERANYIRILEEMK